MTQILIDQFQDDIYVFADGRCTAGDYIVQDNFNKIDVKKSNSYEIVTVLAGHPSIRDYLVLKYMENRGSQFVRWAFEQRDHEDTLHEIEGLIIDKDLDNCTIEMFIFSKSDKREIGVMKTYMTDIPIFFGSGTLPLRTAYNTLKIGEKKNNPKLTFKKYLGHIQDCFDESAAIVNSCGPLNNYYKVTT